jgi:hypothetical protein
MKVKENHKSGVTALDTLMQLIARLKLLCLQKREGHTSQGYPKKADHVLKHPSQTLVRKFSHHLPVDPSSLFPHLKSFSAWKHLMLKL